MARAAPPPSFPAPMNSLVSIALRRILSGLALPALVACSSAPRQTAEPAPVADRRVTGPEAVTEADVRRLLTALADDSLEGRMTGSRGSSKAAALIAAEMRRIGLEPAGDSGYFQRVPVAMRTISSSRAGETRTMTIPALQPSFAALDTIPAERRRAAVNVVGILRGTDPVLRDSAVLIDAHYDH